LPAAARAAHAAFPARSLPALKARIYYLRSLGSARPRYDHAAFANEWSAAEVVALEEFVTMSAPIAAAAAAADRSGRLPGRSAVAIRVKLTRLREARGLVKPTKKASRRQERRYSATTMLRITAEMAERLDAIRPFLTDIDPDATDARAAAVRVAIARGLDEIEADLRGLR